jgi:glycosyltransferase involved in cell wall biosynthesis
LVEPREGFVAYHCREWRFGRWLREQHHILLNFLGKTLKALRFLFFSLRARGDVIHAHDLDALPFGFLAARRCKARLVYDSHEFCIEQWVQGARPGSFTVPLPLLARLERFLIRRADAVIAANASYARELSSLYAIPTPMVLRNCGALAPEGQAAFSLRSHLGLGPEDRIVLHTGDLNPKGRALREVVLAFRDLDPKIHLVFLGEGSMEPQLRELARREELERTVHFLKPVPVANLIPTMREADLGAVLMVADCKSHYLVLPNKLLESIAAGLPVVASDLPEIREIVRGYRIGVLCQPQDPEDIARAIQEALAPDGYETFKANLKRAQQDLHWEKESQKLTDLYRGLLPAQR